MQLLYWGTPENGLAHGVISAIDGHVHLRNIPPAEMETYDNWIRDFANAQERLPTTQAVIVSYLEEAGMKNIEFNPPHIGFEPGTPEPEEPGPQNLSRMKVGDLKKLADELAIDQTGITDKDSLVQAIEAKLKEGEKPESA